MLLDLEDERIRVSVRRVSQDRVRLTLDYPAEDRYRNQVFGALAELLRPEVSPNQPAPARREAA